MKLTPTRLLLLPLAAVLGTGCLVDLDRPGQKNPCEPNPCTQGSRTSCVNEDGEARCLCAPGTVSRPSGACEPVGATNCAEHPGDSAEPDDCQARAQPLTLDGQTRLRTIEPIGDYDFFQVDATAGHIYSVVVNPEGSLMPRVDAFDQGGVWLGAHDGRPQARLSFKARATAPYFVRVSHSPLDMSAASGPYALSFSSIGADDHGDGPDEATSVVAEVRGTTSPRTYSGRLEYDRDEDWFSLSATAGTWYRVSFDTASTVPALAAYRSDSLQQPFLTAQGPVVDFQATSNITLFFVLYSPEGKTGSYRFHVLR